MGADAEAGLSINPNWIVAVVVLLGVYFMTSASACPATTPKAPIRSDLPEDTPHLSITAHLSRKQIVNRDLVNQQSAFVNAMNGMDDLPTPLGEGGPAGVQ